MSTSVKSENQVMTVLLILGMRDNACREVVAEALAHVDGVRDVDVSFFHATARIIHSPACTPDHLTAAVVGAGYRAVVMGPG